MKNSIEYLDKIIGILEKPYFYEMGLYGIVDLNEQNYILGEVFGIDIRVGYCGSTIYDSNNKQIYYESIMGNWKMKEFDSKGYQIYYVDSDGYWYKWEYNSRGNCVYQQDSSGTIEDYR